MNKAKTKVICVIVGDYVRVRLTPGGMKPVWSVPVYVVAKYKRERRVMVFIDGREKSFPVSMVRTTNGLLVDVK